MSVNKVILVGNLGADPDIRTTGGGTKVGDLRIATTDRKKVGDNWENHTEWHSVTVFGKLADNVERFCKKGKQLYIEGKLETQKWTDKEGRDRFTTKVIASEVKFLGEAPKRDGAQAKPQEQAEQHPGYNDEIPF